MGVIFYAPHKWTLRNRGFTCHANIELTAGYSLIHNRRVRTVFFCKILENFSTKERKSFLVNSAITKDKSY